MTRAPTRQLASTRVGSAGSARVVLVTRSRRPGGHRPCSTCSLFTFRPGEGPGGGHARVRRRDAALGRAQRAEMRQAGVVGRRQRPARPTRRRPSARKDGEVTLTDGPYAETKEIALLLLHPRRRGPRRRDGVGGEDARGRVRLGRGAPDGCATRCVSEAAGALEEAFRARACRRPGHGHAPPRRRPRARRGRRPGRVRRRGGRLGPPRRAGPSRRLADHDGVAPGARPAAPRARRRRPRGRARAGGGRRMELELERSSLEDDQLRMIFTCCHPGAAAGGAHGAHAAQRRPA